MNKIIIVEGPQGVGKTTVTNWLREKIPYTNLYRLTGHNDKTPAGRDKSIGMYLALMFYMEILHESGVNLLFDRTFITEEVYCRLGHRQYEFTDVFEYLMNRLNKIDCEVIVINLFCSNEEVLSRRLNRNKPQHLDVNFCVGESLLQQKEYHSLMCEMSDRYKNLVIWPLNTENEDVWKGILERDLINKL